jgi:serine/threonine protein phosphatase PrpC
MAREFASALDTGRVRRHNEDAVVIDAQAGVAVLADGMGGHNAGEVASAMAGNLVCRDLVRWRRAWEGTPSVAAALQAVHRCVAHANQAILDTSLTRPECQGMGTTLVVLVALGAQVLIGHAGDSRAYRWRGGALERLTRDHSLLQEQIDAGLLTPEQAAVATRRNVVTRAVGVGRDLELEAHTHACLPGDLLLMCSDGLSDMLGDAEIARILATGGPLEAACARLVDAANRAGGADNISVVLTRDDAGLLQ